MKDIVIKNTGDTYQSSEFNTFYQNSKNQVVSSGQTMSEADLTQGSKALAIYAATSTFYTDGGTAGDYILSPIDTLLAPDALIDGMLVRFKPQNNNVLILSVTSITRSGSTATVTTTSPHNLVTSGLVLIQGATPEVEYNGIYQITVTGPSTFTYPVIGTPGTPAGGTITVTAGESNVTVDSLPSTRITRENGSGVLPNDLQSGIDTALRYDLGTDAFLLIFPFETAQFYIDTQNGSPVGEEYILIAAGGQQAPSNYFNGFGVSFRPGASNTIGNPVLNIAGLGDKTITKEDGLSNIAINDIITTEDTELRFDSLHDVFILLNGQSSSFVDFTTFYTDSGSANAYILAAAGGLQAPTSYFEGMLVRFRPDNNNGITVTVTSLTNVGSYTALAAAVNTFPANAFVAIEGAKTGNNTFSSAYNGSFYLENVTGANFRYRMNESSVISPAGGTITATGPTSVTVNIASLGIKSVKLPDKVTDPPINQINTNSDTFLRFDSVSDVFILSNGTSNANALNQGISYTPNNITLNRDPLDLNDKITFTSGVFDFSDGTGSAVLPSITKDITATWIAGNNLGGRDSFTIDQDSQWYCYAIYNSTTKVVDAFITNRDNPVIGGLAPSFPVGFDKQAYVGSFRRVSSVNIAFTQRGQYFYLDNPVRLYGPAAAFTGLLSAWGPINLSSSIGIINGQLVDEDITVSLHAISVTAPLTNLTASAGGGEHGDNNMMLIPIEPDGGGGTPTSSIFSTIIAQVGAGTPLTIDQYGWIDTGVKI